MCCPKALSLKLLVLKLFVFSYARTICSLLLLNYASVAVPAFAADTLVSLSDPHWQRLSSHNIEYSPFYPTTASVQNLSAEELENTSIYQAINNAGNVQLRPKIPFYFRLDAGGALKLLASKECDVTLRLFESFGKGVFTSQPRVLSLGAAEKEIRNPAARAKWLMLVADSEAEIQLFLEKQSPSSRRASWQEISFKDTVSLKMLIPKVRCYLKYL